MNPQVQAAEPMVLTPVFGLQHRLDLIYKFMSMHTEAHNIQNFMELLPYHSILESQVRGIMHDLEILIAQLSSQAAQPEYKMYTDSLRTKIPETDEHWKIVRDSLHKRTRTIHKGDIEQIDVYFYWLRMHAAELNS
jgi:hypothetical protein